MFISFGDISDDSILINNFIYNVSNCIKSYCIKFYDSKFYKYKTQNLMSVFNTITKTISSKYILWHV